MLLLTWLPAIKYLASGALKITFSAPRFNKLWWPNDLPQEATGEASKGKGQVKGFEITLKPRRGPKAKAKAI